MKTNFREDFPIFSPKNQPKPLVYLDSAASAQKPRIVIDAITQFYSSEYANIHRGIYALSANATEMYEEARQTVQRFINAKSPREIVFTSGATAGINLVAQNYREPDWQAGDEIILSEMEHHSNIVPWYLLSKKKGVVLKIIPVTDTGELDLHQYQKIFSTRTKLVAVTHVSNVLGTINPIKKMTQIAHENNVPVLVDGAQAIPHLPLDVEDLACDFYVFSGHKLYGPTGVGVLYVNEKQFAKMHLSQGGGGMIKTVAFDHITYADPPQSMEAGTPPIASVIALAAAIHYLNAISMTDVYSQGKALLHYAENELNSLEGVRIIGKAADKIALLSLVTDRIHAHDLATVLDHENIATRAGHHCAMPLMQRFNVPATLRVSFGIYNDQQDVDALMSGIKLAMRLFS